MPPEPAIQVDALQKTYGSKAGNVSALKGVSLSVRPGELFGLLGPNGAGKTTFIHILAGLVQPTGGQARVFGHDVITDYRRAHRNLGLAGQEPDFDWWITVQDALVYHCGYHGIPRKEAIPRAEALLKRFGLWEKRRAKAAHLSGGMKRRLLIARAVIHEPSVVILDEPTAGVDVQLRYQLWDFVRELNAKGTTVLLTTHYIEEAENLCDRVGIIDRGEIIALDTPTRLMAEGERDLVVVDLDEPLKAREHLPATVDAAFHSVSDDGTSLMLQGAEGGPLAALAVRELTQHDFRVASVSIQRKKLEDVFLRLTHRQQGEVDA